MPGCAELGKSAEGTNCIAYASGLVRFRPTLDVPWALVDQCHGSTVYWIDGLRNEILIHTLLKPEAQNSSKPAGQLLNCGGLSSQDSKK
jgi:hypothetical protein